MREALAPGATHRSNPTSAGDDATGVRREAVVYWGQQGGVMVTKHVLQAAEPVI